MRHSVHMSLRPKPGRAAAPPASRRARRCRASRTPPLSPGAHALPPCAPPAGCLKATVKVHVCLLNDAQAASGSARHATRHLGTRYRRSTSPKMSFRPQHILHRAVILASRHQTWRRQRAVQAVWTQIAPTRPGSWSTKALEVRSSRWQSRPRYRAATAVALLKCAGHGRRDQVGSHCLNHWWPMRRGIWLD